MEFFEYVFDCLQTSNIESKSTFHSERSKIESKKQKIEYLKQNFDNFTFNHKSDILQITQPSFKKLCKVVHPTRLKRPKECSSNISLAKILHSVAHIEYNAIDLGLSSAYSFRDLPLEYYFDFIELAHEEVMHFHSIESILNKLGFSYGDFAVHENLFLAMRASENDLISRMALIHKGLEALGLDANPFVCKKIQSSNTPLKDEILDALNIILNDEIKHVAKGSKWLKYAQDLYNDDRSLAEILKDFRDFNIIGKIPNIEARLNAGYTNNEIQELLRLYY